MSRRIDHEVERESWPQAEAMQAVRIYRNGWAEVLDREQERLRKAMALLQLARETLQGRELDLGKKPTAEKAISKASIALDEELSWLEKTLDDAVLDTWGSVVAGTFDCRLAPPVQRLIFDLCEVWVQSGGSLGLPSRDAGKQNPLLRYLVYYLGAAMGDDAPRLSTVHDFVAKRVKGKMPARQAPEPIGLNDEIPF